MDEAIKKAQEDEEQRRQAWDDLDSQRNVQQ